MIIQRASETCNNLVTQDLIPESEKFATTGIKYSNAGEFVNLNPRGPGCSKLTMSLVNVSLKFQTLISEISQYFLLKKYEKLLHCKSFSYFFKQKISVHLVIKL